jgi:hypothetical protein
MKKHKSFQVVVRLTPKLNSDIEKAAEELGLTKASWLRQIAINSLCQNK